MFLQKQELQEILKNKDYKKLQNLLDQISEFEITEIINSFSDDEKINALQNQLILNKLNDKSLEKIILSLNDINKLKILNFEFAESRLDDNFIRVIIGELKDIKLKEIIIDGFYFRILSYFDFIIEDMNDEEFIKFIIDSEAYKKYNGEFLYNKILNRNKEVAAEIWQRLTYKISENKILNFSFENVIKKIIEEENFNSGEYLIYIWVFNHYFYNSDISGILKKHDESYLSNKLIKDIREYPQHITISILECLNNSYELILNPLVNSIIFDEKNDKDSIITIIKKYNDLQILQLLNIDIIFDFFNSFELYYILKNFDLNNKLLLFSNEKIINKLNEEDVIDYAISSYNKNTIKLIPKTLIKRLTTHELTQILYVILNSNDYRDYNKLLIDLNLPFEKVIFILDSLNIEEDKKELVLFNLFPSRNKLNKSIRELKQDIIENCKVLLINLKSTEYINSNYLVRDMMGCFDPISFEKITQSLFEDQNIEKKIDKNFFLIYFNMFANKVKNSNTFFRFLLYEKSVLGAFYFDENFNEIIINTNNIKDNLEENLDVFNTIFHELTHVEQEDNLKNGEINFENLKMAKDSVLYNKRDFYKKSNYIYLSFESNARGLAAVKAIRFFGKYGERAKKIYYLKQQRKFEIDCAVFENILRDYQGKRMNLDEIFDLEMETYEIAEVAKVYPILLMEYNENGTKKTILEIIEFLDYNLSLIMTVEKNSIEYKKVLAIIKFYKSYLENMRRENSCDNESQKYIVKAIEQIKNRVML